MSASPNINRVLHDLQRAVIAIANGNVPMLRMGWIMAPRTRVYLQELRDNGQRVFPEIDNNQLRGYPIRESTQVPINLGSGGNESEIYFCDFSQIVVGEAMGMTITMAENVSYIDANGAMQSAFSRDETVIRAIVQHDINTRHPESIVVLNGVTWGTQALEVPARQTP